MNQMTPHQTQLFTFFAIAWVLLGVITIGFYGAVKNVAQKRKWHARIVIFSGILFFLFSGSIILLNDNYEQAPFFIFVFIPAIFLITWGNIKAIQFCDKCGRTVYLNQMTFRKPKFCPDCGNTLYQREP